MNGNMRLSVSEVTFARQIRTHNVVYRKGPECKVKGFLDERSGLLYIEGLTFCIGVSMGAMPHDQISHDPY